MRRLRITVDSACHRVGTDFQVCELLLDALLALTNNELYAFLDDVVVTPLKARAFAAAIDGIEFDDQWGLHLHLLDLTEEHVDAFIAWLRLGEFMMEPA